MKKTAYVVLIFALALLLGAGDNHDHLQTALCLGCLHAPVLIQTATIDLPATLAELGAVTIAASPQPLSCLVVPFTLLRAPPSV